MIATWWLIPRIVSGLVHPSYKWINPTYPIYSWGYDSYGQESLFTGLVGEKLNRKPWAFDHQI